LAVARPGHYRGVTDPTAPRRAGLREVFALERPLPSTPASRTLRALILATAVATVLVEVVNLSYTDEVGTALKIRTFWAVLRAVGFLALMRAVRFGRPASRPFGLVLAITTVFAVARLVQPRHGGLMPHWQVLVGFLVLTGLCLAVVAMLYRSPSIAAHLSGRPVRRHIPGWVLTARIGALAFSALLAVPFAVAVPSLGGVNRHDPVALVLVPVWLGLIVLVGFTASFASFFVVLGRPWARSTLGLLSVALTVLQPLLCYLVLGVDSLIRDGVPMVLTTLLTLYALHRSRGVRTFYRPDRPDRPDPRVAPPARA
jgi:hypothetical protein